MKILVILERYPIWFFKWNGFCIKLYFSFILFLNQAAFYVRMAQFYAKNIFSSLQRSSKSVKSCFDDFDDVGKVENIDD